MFDIRNNPESKEVHMHAKKASGSELTRQQKSERDQSTNEVEDFQDGLEDRLMANQQILEYLFDLK